MGSIPVRAVHFRVELYDPCGSFPTRNICDSLNAGRCIRSLPNSWCSTEKQHPFLKTGWWGPDSMSRNGLVFPSVKVFLCQGCVSSTRRDAFQRPVWRKKQFSWYLASTRWDFAAQTSMDSRWQHTTVTKKSSYFCIQTFLFYIRVFLKMESWFFFPLKTGSCSGVWFWCKGLISRVDTRRISLKYLHKNEMLGLEGYMCWTHMEVHTYSTSHTCGLHTFSHLILLRCWGSVCISFFDQVSLEMGSVLLFYYDTFVWCSPNVFYTWKRMLGPHCGCLDSFLSKHVHFRMCLIN